MKYILLLIATLFAVSANSQSVAAGQAGDAIVFTLDGDFLVKKDTSSNGVITIQMVPVKSFTSDVSAEIGRLVSQIERTKKALADMEQKKSDLSKILSQLGVVEKPAKKKSSRTALPGPQEPTGPTKAVHQYKRNAYRSVSHKRQ